MEEKKNKSSEYPTKYALNKSVIVDKYDNLQESFDVSAGEANKI